MTDIEKTKQLFNEIWLKFTNQLDEYDIGYWRLWEDQIIKIDEGEWYGCFYCVFIFDKNGKFKHHWCWE